VQVLCTNSVCRVLFIFICFLLAPRVVGIEDLGFIWATMVDVRQRLSAALHAALGSYLRDASPEGSADAVVDEYVLIEFAQGEPQHSSPC
jgi:hypothetical protein